MTNAQCYKNANMDKKLFSKIKNDIFQINEALFTYDQELLGY